MIVFNVGQKQASLNAYGKLGCANTTSLRELNGSGKRRTVAKSKPRWLGKQLDLIRRIGGKNGSKWFVLVDQSGIPLKYVVAGANRHDSRLLDGVLEVHVNPPEQIERNLCLDAGFVGKSKVVEEHGIVPHIRSRGEEKRELEKNPEFQAKRWVVEAFHSWLKRFRKNCPRYEKTLESFCGLLALAMGIIVFNKVVTIYP